MNEAYGILYKLLNDIYLIILLQFQVYCKTCMMTSIGNYKNKILYF
jgi:hypothetical protein